MRTLYYANLVLAFAQEIWLLGVAAYWGYTAGQGSNWQWLLALAVPAAGATFWGLFLAPKAAVTLSAPAVVAIKWLVFGLGTFALFSTGLANAATVFGVLSAVHLALLTLFAVRPVSR